jgi:heme-degrading monooxygenase HmoA
MPVQVAVELLLPGPHVISGGQRGGDCGVNGQRGGLSGEGAEPDHDKSAAAVPAGIRGIAGERGPLGSRTQERRRPMSFTHVVSFRWKDRTTPADVEKVTAALTALAPTFNGVESYRCGADVSRTADSYDYAVVGVFATRDDFVAYRDHPEHQRIIKELIGPHLASRIVVQLQS